MWAFTEILMCFLISLIRNGATAWHFEFHLSFAENKSENKEKINQKISLELSFKFSLTDLQFSCNNAIGEDWVNV